jgi:hypothetical protein
MRDFDPVLGNLDLSTLACRAAAELDRVGRGKKTTLSALEHLAGRLCSVFDQAPQRNIFDHIVDPLGLTLIGRAMAQSVESDFAAPSIATLIEQAAQVSKDLASAQSVNLDSSKVGELKRFCLALSHVAASYEPALGGPEDDHSLYA